MTPAILEVIRLPERSSLRFRRAAPGWRPRWHYHPEFELALVENGGGVLGVGDSATRFGPGELVLIGPSLPHVWSGRKPPKGSGRGRASVAFIHFREGFLGSGFWNAPEFATGAQLLCRSRQGVRFIGPDGPKAAERIRRMARMPGPGRLLELARLLDFLGSSGGQRNLSTPSYAPKLDRTDAARVEAVRRYLRTHLAGRISQSAAAARAGLSPARFSAWFRSKTDCTFPAYINEIRVAHALHLMRERRMKISGACFASGFRNLANFNRRFRAIKGLAPREYLLRHSPHRL